MHHTLLDEDEGNATSNTASLVRQFEERILRLQQERDEAVLRAQQLEQENKTLKNKLAFYEGPNAPPSRAVLRKLRPKAEPKKRGAPIGHKGATRPHPTPDDEVDVTTTRCPECGEDAGPPCFLTSKTVTEKVEPAKTRHTKYNIASYKCPRGHEFTARHPDCPVEGVFGPNVLTHVTMLKYHLRGSIRRVQEFLQQEDGIELSEAGVHNVLQRVAKACKAEYDRLQQRVREAPFRYIDETGARVEGEPWWLWNFRASTGEVLTVIRDSRGADVVREILGDEPGPAVVDGARAYEFLKVAQRCWSHLLRMAEEVKDASPAGKLLLDRLNDIFDRLKAIKAVVDAEPPAPLEERVAHKLAFDLEMEAVVEEFAPHSELAKVVTYIRRALGSWFVCLLYRFMQPTNNLAEQSIREHVIIRRLIGTFRSMDGSQNYTYIASLLASWRLQGKNPFEQLNALLRRELCLGGKPPPPDEGPGLPEWVKSTQDTSATPSGS